jgi:hypothetical protein
MKSVQSPYQLGGNEIADPARLKLVEKAVECIRFRLCAPPKGSVHWHHQMVTRVIRVAFNPQRLGKQIGQYRSS